MTITKQGLIPEREKEPIIDTRTYEEKVESKIREKYSLNDELAILRQRDKKEKEFNEYFDFVEECKKQVKGD